MGNTYSKEVYEFRKQCKEEAKKLSFLPNKVAKNHLLNYAPKQTKDPRSEQQFKAWEENISDDTLQPLHGSAREAGESFVVDIMEGRRIGLQECPPGVSNFVAVKFEIISANDEYEQRDKQHTQYRLATESRGWNHDRWIDKFRMLVFPLPRTISKFKSKYSYKIGLSIKFGSMDDQAIKEKTAEAVYRTRHGRDISVKVNLSGTVINRDLISYKCKLRPTWFQWKGTGWHTDTFIKISAQTINNSKLPTWADFLPYTQWPPMVLHTGRTRLELMVEEEQAADETEFR